MGNMGAAKNRILFRVQMLGGFQVLINGEPAFKRLERSRQVLNLLAYLLVARNKVTSQERLMEILWADEDSEDPANALKNLIYRLRRLLSRIEPLADMQCVLLQNGTYIWNNKVECAIDTEEMEYLMRKAADISLPIDQRINLYKEAISLYKGAFLPDWCNEPWVIPVCSYYQNLYMQCVRGAISLLFSIEKFEEISLICETAISFEPYEETLHESLIRAFINMNKKIKALDHYNSISKKFYKDLGVKLGDSIRSLHDEIIYTLNSVETDIANIKGSLSEHQKEGAFFCEYEIFKQLFRVESRSAERAGQAVFICLLTLTDLNNQVPEQTVLVYAMEKLKEVIIGSLRKGDVISRFSPSQYILMLPANYENGEMVLERVIDKFHIEYKNPSVKVHISLEPVVSAV